MEQIDGKPGAVILGGSFHSLGAARNLSTHGVSVCVMDVGPCVSQFSRAVRSFVQCPSVDDDETFVDFLIQVAREKEMKGWVLFPSTDDYVKIIARHWERLDDHYCLTIQPWGVIQHLYDKRLTHHLAEKTGIPTPATYNPRSLDDLAALNLDYPLVLKPAISKQFMAATKKKAFRADNESDLINLYEQTAAIIDPSEILIQELIPGRAENLYSFVGFFRGGEVVSGMSARRLRQHPMEFGRASTYVVSVGLPELEAKAVKLLKGIDFSGLAEVEFMYDQKDSRFELLEVNPRIWGWHTIAIHAGLDLPYLAYAEAIGQVVEIGPERQGVKWVRLITDTPTVMKEVLSGGLTLRQYLSSMKGNLGFAVLSLRDPVPFVADLFLGPYNYFRSRGF